MLASWTTSPSFAMSMNELEEAYSLSAGSLRNVSVLNALSAMVAQWSSSNSTSNSGGRWCFVVVEEGAAICSPFLGG
jgi:hypothetical protein